MQKLSEMQAYLIGAAIAGILMYGIPAVLTIKDDDALMGVYAGSAFMGLALVSYVVRPDKRIGKFQALLGAVLLIGSIAYALKG